MRRLIILMMSLWAMMTPDMGTALRAQSLPPARWREIPWPFPRDAWPAGKAFRCDSPACGEDTVLSVRVKLGFCSCTGGVRDDDEVDNVADVDMITPVFVATGPGEVHGSQRIVDHFTRVASRGGLQEIDEYTTTAGVLNLVMKNQYVE